MCKRYQPLLAILSYIHILNAVSVYVTPSSASAPGAAAAIASPSITSTTTSTSVKPSTLLLPSGFDSQLPPRQPMLYPFVVSSAQPTPATRKPIGPFITPGWIPISAINANVNELLALLPNPLTSSTTTPQPSYPAPVPPILEDRISKYVLETNDNGPVFESIIYGTWKPDPPLQPVEIVNATTAQYSSSTSTRSSGSSSIGSDSGHGSGTMGYVADGKFSNKTINRQHGGFIDNKQQQKPIKFEKYERDSYEKSPTLERISNESIDNIEQKARIATKFVKKQGRQKIRPNSTGPTTTTAAMTRSTTTTLGTTASQQFPFTLESTEQSATIRDVIKASINVPVEVVRQINDSIEIKYNHKQTSRHSIEMTEHERYDENHHHQHHHHNHRYGEHHPDDDAQVEQQTKKFVTTTPTELEQQEQQQEEDEDDDLGNSSVIRMNWPTDFMDTPLASSTEDPSDDEKTSSQSTTKGLSMESAESTELPLALSALNIPPSLWPKLPGNITKLGSPYAAENSLEEPAICVPITVREFNMMNSNEVVNIERVFCFPMPGGSNTARESVKSTSTTRSSFNRVRGRSTISPPVVKANIQNYEEYYETHSTNRSNILKSKYYLLCYFVVFYYKFIFY